MQVQMATVCGYEDLAADGTVDLTDFRKRYPLAVTESFFSDELQQEIGALEIETTGRWRCCWRVGRRLPRPTSRSSSAR